jgi:hyperosmotically inducible periplasmic protein
LVVERRLKMSLSQRVMVVVFSLGVGLAFAGCDQQGSSEKAGRQMDEAGKAVGEGVEKAGDYLDDAAITAKIKGDILSDPLLKVLQINVTTTNGIVTLSGVVDSKESIDRAVEIARRVKEVKSVENSLVVKGAG